MILADPAQVTIGIGQVGLELDRPVEGRGRLLEAAGCVQGEAQVAMGPGIIALELDCPGEGRDRRLEAAGFTQDDTQGLVGLEMIGLSSIARARAAIAASNCPASLRVLARLV